MPVFILVSFIILLCISKSVFKQNDSKNTKNDLYFIWEWRFIVIYYPVSKIPFVSSSFFYIKIPDETVISFWFKTSYPWLLTYVKALLLS